MNEENFEGPIVTETVSNELIEAPIAVVKVKKPRSEKQQLALKALLKKRQEMAVIQRAERKERRAPKWYRELNCQQKEIDELKEVIEQLKNQVISSPSGEEDKIGLHDDVYYYPKEHNEVEIQTDKPLRFSQNDRLSLLNRIL